MTDAAEAEDPVVRAVDGGVAVLTLNRPERLNAWTPLMEQRWFDALDSVATDPDVRAVVVTGAGRAFCAGLDTSHISARSSGAEPAPTRTRRLSGLASFPKPVIGAINGAAVGLGMALALGCDVRFGSPETRFITMFARLGLTAEFGVPWLLPRVVGHSRALDLLLSGRPVAADEALELHLLDRVVSPGELVAAAVDYGRGLAERCSPLSMASIKGQVLADAERPLDASEAESSARNRTPRVRQEFGVGAAAARERLAPQFAPLSSDDPEVLRWLGEAAPAGGRQR